MWPFGRKKPAPLDPVQLRDRLIAVAASGSRRTLRAECLAYKDQIAEHLDVVARLPDGVSQDDGAVDRHVQCLVALAQCLAADCGAPQLWERLTRVSDDSPFAAWNHWYAELPNRMERREYDSLVAEARSFIERAKTLRGSAARQQETFLYGRLGQLLFHSGHVPDSIEPFETALRLCVEADDVEGQLVYLANLAEAHRHLDDGQAASVVERLIQLKRAQRAPIEGDQKRLHSLKRGEPLCRIVCARNGEELELDEIDGVGEGSYQFHFRRNRPSLRKTQTLVADGNRLASDGKLSDALESYREAGEVDPYDPDPVYQSGMCLLELGAYTQARDAFDEVERMAPGWFRCRTDRWLADGLARGTISQEEFLLLRTLDDGGLPPRQAVALADEGLKRFPDFAPLYLLRGDLNESDAEAAAAYRRGLSLVEEPDLESRLLCALAGRLPADDPERKRLVAHALGSRGSLVAAATARLMGLQ